MNDTQQAALSEIECTATIDCAIAALARVQQLAGKVRDRTKDGDRIGVLMSLAKLHAATEEAYALVRLARRV